jgi:hypothetical protein
MSRMPLEPNDHTPDGEDSALRLPSLPRRLPLLERIMAEAIRLPDPARFRSRAQFTFFCGGEPETLAGYDGQLEMVGRCLEWFVFDYYLPSIEATPAQHWLSQNWDQLSQNQQEQAQQCLYFILGIFEVISVEPNRTMVVEDLLRPAKTGEDESAPRAVARHAKTSQIKPGQRYTIREEVLTAEVQPGQLLLARLFPHQQAYILSGMAAVMNPNATGQIKNLIRRKKLVPAYILKDLDGVELENLFGRNIADIERSEDSVSAHRILKRYVDEICPGCIAFDELIRQIRESPDPFGAAAALCDQAKIFCRHEMDLILACIMNAWYSYHRS